MKSEIKRNNWSRFLKKFNSDNQFRRTELNVRYPGDKADSIRMGPFLGLVLTKKGRFIDGVQFLNGGWNAEKVAEPAVTIKEPSHIWLERNKEGQDRQLRIRAKDGSEVQLELMGEPQFDQQRHLIEKVAYSMFERRGCCHGNDMGDWYEAEQRIKQIEMELTR